MTDLTNMQHIILASGLEHKGELWTPISGAGQMRSARSLEDKGFGILATSQSGPGRKGYSYYFIIGHKRRSL